MLLPPLSLPILTRYVDLCAAFIGAVGTELKILFFALFLSILSNTIWTFYITKVTNIRLLQSANFCSTIFDSTTLITQDVLFSLLVIKTYRQVLGFWQAFAAMALDYDALRAQAMGSGNDEAVTVNTRALIDKVLARYSGEWTTLRELLQNAADASASKVTIRLQTIPSATVPVPQTSDPSTRLRHVMLHHTLKSSVIENDGVPFQSTDWARLKKIAEGNPDETKIGAFGVGFYSVFAECEEPFVSSGKEALAFYWKGDALFTKKLQLGDVQNTHTTFVLPMRNTTSPVPQLLSLCQFLAGSLTFVGLENIELWLDEWRILQLRKVAAPSSHLDMPKDIDVRTQDGLMQITSVVREAAQIHAQWLKAVEWDRSISSDKATTEQPLKGANSTPSFRTFFSRLAAGANAAAEKAAKQERALQAAISEDLMGESTATIFLHVNKAAIRTTVGQKFASELERATKKPPSRNTMVSVLTATYDEHVASASTMSGQVQGTMNIFSSVLPTKGRIFIGFPTNQTTGMQAHISTPSVIPTVERESIDLNNRFIRTWNVELLRVAGIVARLSWNSEMVALRNKLAIEATTSKSKKVDPNQISAILPEALFLHTVFAWNESTPASEVGNLIEEAFWSCSKNISIDILSSQGVLPSSKVRIVTEDLGFVEGIPQLPKPLIDTGVVRRLRDYGVITDITISDIKSELESRPLDASQLQRFLVWVGHKAQINELDGAMVRSLLKVAVVNDDQDGETRIIEIGQMSNFLNPSRIPAEMPVPPTTMPFKFTRSISKADLDALGWEDLHIVPWLRWIVDNVGGKSDLSLDQDITRSPAFASQVLPVLSKQWEGLSQSSKATVTELMSVRTVIPTKSGMRKPADSYFPSVKLFEDLPVIVGVHSVKEKMLTAFGVRKTIDIGVVFDRLMAPPSYSEKDSHEAEHTRWSHVDLIKYLTSVRQDIPLSDIKRLKSTPMCPAESKDGNVNQSELYLVSDLFEPDDALRRLGLRILQWPGVYRPTSAEGRFLNFLGLKSAPSYPELIEIMASSVASGDLTLRDRAFSYLINQYQIKGYSAFDVASVQTPFLPIQGSEKKLQTPRGCFINERSAILGFDILRRDLHLHPTKFGVQANPPMSECVERLLQNPPQTHRNAREVFAYFTSRLIELEQKHADMVANAAIVPVKSKTIVPSEKISSSDNVRHIAPNLCFLGNDDKYAEIFDYDDFGDGNHFLMRCGSKHEPNTQELAAKVIREPTRVYTALEMPKYLELLRNLADSWQTLKKNKGLVRDMRSAPFLLGYRELASKNVKSPARDEDEEDEESTVRTAELATAGKITVINDTITYGQFKEHLLAAPMEEVLEEFYISLGSSELADIVEQRHTIGSIVNDQRGAEKLHKLVAERSRLFLHDTPKDNVSHDAKWIEKSLSVVCVRSISLRKSLQGTNLSRNQAKSAIVAYDRQTGFVLYVTVAYDAFEVAQGLTGLLLKRPKIQQTMILEMLLETDLVKLRTKGYNVERILRQKANEARMAEEQRKKQLEQEQQELKKREATWREIEANIAREREQNLMPGIFPDTPDRNRADQISRTPDVNAALPPMPPRGFFANLGRRLGIDDRAHASQTDLSTPSITQGHEDLPPPPYTENQPQKIPPAPQPEAVTAPHRLQQNLLSAIAASRPHNSNSLSSTPSITDVKETHSYCDSKPAHNITYVSETSTVPPVRIYLSKDLLGPPSNLTPQKFLSANAGALNAFASVLLDCADVYKLARGSVHIFYDGSGSTIAFNQNKALFFNYRYFDNLHLEAVQRKEMGEALVYWSVVMAHELA